MMRKPNPSDKRARPVGSDALVEAAGVTGRRLAARMAARRAAGAAARPGLKLIGQFGASDAASITTLDAPGRPRTSGRAAISRLRPPLPNDGAYTVASTVEPALEPNDPRWVLAVRVQGRLQGAVLGPEDRQKLIHQGRAMGLNGFESNLVIAIVQDQARRGMAIDHAASALRFVPMRGELATGPSWLKIAFWSLIILAIEGASLAWWIQNYK